MSAYLPTIVVLGLVAMLALGLVRLSEFPAAFEAERTAAARALGLVTLLQAVHFIEETATGFHTELGELLGLPAMSFAFFVGFNVAWLMAWIAAIPGIRRGAPAAFFAAYFLAIAGMVNGIAHPALSLAGDRYFPGTISSPLLAAAGFWLHMQLRRSGRPRAS